MAPVLGGKESAQRNQSPSRRSNVYDSVAQTSAGHTVALLFEPIHSSCQQCHHEDSQECQAMACSLAVYLPPESSSSAGWMSTMSPTRTGSRRSTSLKPAGASRQHGLWKWVRSVSPHPPRLARAHVNPLSMPDPQDRSLIRQEDGSPSTHPAQRQLHDLTYDPSPRSRCPARAQAGTRLDVLGVYPESTEGDGDVACPVGDGGFRRAGWTIGVGLAQGHGS